MTHHARHRDDSIPADRRFRRRDLRARLGWQYYRPRHAARAVAK